MAALKVLPVNVLERICYHFDSTSAVHLAVAADNVALNSVLLHHLLLVKLWQSTDYVIVRGLAANNVERVSFQSWTITAEKGWQDVIAYLHEHHGRWGSPSVMRLAADSGHTDVVRFLAHHHPRHGRHNGY